MPAGVALSIGSDLRMASAPPIFHRSSYGRSLRSHQAAFLPVIPSTVVLYDVRLGCRVNTASQFNDKALVKSHHRQRSPGRPSCNNRNNTFFASLLGTWFCFQCRNIRLLQLWLVRSELRCGVIFAIWSIRFNNPQRSLWGVYDLDIDTHRLQLRNGVVWPHLIWADECRWF